MKRLPTKYLAGLIDGEGCIDLNISYGKYIRPRVRIALAEPSKFVLDMIQNTYGGHLYKREVTNPDWQNSYSWELAGYGQVCCFLRNIKNFLYIKRQQAEFILELENLVRGEVLGDEPKRIAREELKLMKKDPHRLSEKAVERMLQVL